jgi:hypothetical protein
VGIIHFAEDKMICIRCQRQDIDYFRVTIQGAKKQAVVGLCVDCTDELRLWLALVPEGYAKQVRQLESLATSVGR